MKSTNQLKLKKKQQQQENQQSLKIASKKEEEDPLPNSARMREQKAQFSELWGRIKE